MKYKQKLDSAHSQNNLSTISVGTIQVECTSMLDQVLKYDRATDIEMPKKYKQN
jgi:hypothetical protein